MTIRSYAKIFFWIELSLYLPVVQNSLKHIMNSLTVEYGLPWEPSWWRIHCNAGGPGSIPWSERPPGERIGYLLQYSCTSLAAQLVKSPPAEQETWDQSLGWEDPLEKGVYSLQYPGLENSMNCIVHGVAKNRTPLSNFHFTTIEYKCKILEWDRWGSCRSVELWLRALLKCPLACPQGHLFPQGNAL